MAKRIDPRIEIGHVHLKVSDMERALTFYCDVLGFEVMQRWGTSVAILGAGDSHHHIGLNTWGTLNASERPQGTAGLYHFAIRYPDRRALGDALRRLREAGVTLDGASDHGISEALYLRDPDGNTIELYRDRPREQWPQAADGSAGTGAAPLDLEALLEEASAPQVPEGAPAEDPGLTEVTRRNLTELRTRLLDLHKVLLDDAKVAYELDRGRVGTTANLLQLVINDPWFAWLHSVSELIVRIDELVAKDSPATEAEAAILFEHVERLLTASENGQEFQKRYYEALQRQPAVVVAHANVRRTLKARHE